MTFPPRPTGHTAGQHETEPREERREMPRNGTTRRGSRQRKRRASIARSPARRRLTLPATIAQGPNPPTPGFAIAGGSPAQDPTYPLPPETPGRPPLPSAASFLHSSREYPARSERQGSTGDGSRRERDTEWRPRNSPPPPRRRAVTLSPKSTPRVSCRKPHALLWMASTPSTR